jgi:hypothetical protein
MNPDCSDRSPGGLKAHQDSSGRPRMCWSGTCGTCWEPNWSPTSWSVKETQAVRQWVDGERKPSAEVTHRLRTAYHVAALLAERDSRPVVQAWFQGMNPQLDDVPLAGLVREG